MTNSGQAQTRIVRVVLAELHITWDQNHSLCVPSAFEHLAQVPFK